jgi:hypothetical protein
MIHCIGVRKTAISRASVGKYSKPWKSAIIL